MSSLRNLFEKEIKNKLALKASGFQSEETILLKAFKYFDLDNSGECSKDEFVKAVTKIGITGFTDKNLHEIFESYDLNHNDNLDYKEFAGALFGNNSVSKKPEEEKKGAKKYQEGSKFAYLDQEEVKNILGKIRERLVGRGIRGITSIGKAFRIMDDNRSQTLDMEEFKKAANDYRFGLNEREVEMAFKAFDRKNRNAIDYDQFLRTIRGNMNDFRKNFCMQAFKKMDKDGSGFLTIDDIRGTYNAKFHPEVKAGRKTEDEVFLEFLETFEATYDMLAGEQADGKITIDEWLEYYENVSMSIDDDAYFELMMNNCWRMNNNTTYNNEKKGWSNKDEDGKFEVVQGSNPQRRGRGQESNIFNVEKDKPKGPAVNNFSKKGDDVLLRFREKISARGTRGIFGIRRSFMIADDNNSKTVDFAEFKKLLKDYRYEISDPDLKKLFGIFDLNRNGDVDYEEFLRGIVGEMNDFRKGLAKRAFSKMDKNGNGTLELDDIRGVYNAKQHPEVKAGKKTEDEVLAEFLDNFEYHFSLLNQNASKDRAIGLEEWYEYFNHISMSIDDDKYFEAMMNSCWNLDGSRKTYGKGWKGEY